MQTLSSTIEKIEKLLSILLLICMTILIFVAVIYRYFLKDPIFWANEASLFMMAWLTFLGGSLGLKYRSQASITFIIERCTTKVRTIIQWVSTVIILIALAILIYYSAFWVVDSASLKSSSMRIPMWIPYSSVPVGLSFAWIHLVNNWLQEWKMKGVEAHDS